MTDFEAELKNNAETIERLLDRFLAGPRLSGPGLPSERLVAAMRHGSLGGGKRLRPLLVRQTAAIFGVPAAQTEVAGLAIEMVHCYSLIQDDLPAMDDDDLRRGRPTVHKAFDDATAILASDALLTHALGHLALVGHADAEVRMQLVYALVRGAGAGGMVGGQMRDIEGETAPLDADGIAGMQAMKTGALIQAAVQMGALLGRAAEDEVAHLGQYAQAAGRAFQLADDILDVTSSAEALGKATGKDQGKGKQTLVALIGVQAARQRLAETVDEAVAALAPFGARAAGLEATARYFADREK